MAPMTTWSSNDDYTVSDDEVRYYEARVKGVGLVITGCTHVTPNGIGFTNEFASYDDSFLPSLKKLALAAKSGGAPAILQIFHAGNKALPELTPGNEVVSASAVEVAPTPFVNSQTIPRALSHAEILNIIHALGEVTRRAIEAGFDGVELHGAHGFLIQNFFSPAFNLRTDEWGGSADNRMKFALAVVEEVQKVISLHSNRPFLLGYRISPEEPGGYTLEDIFPLLDKLIDLKIDYLHASLASVLQSTPTGSTDKKPIAKAILDYVNERIPVIAAGQIKNLEDAASAISMGLSLVAIGQTLVINPNWMELAAKGEKVDESLKLSKLPDLAIPSKLWNIIDAVKGWFKVEYEG